EQRREYGQLLSDRVARLGHAYPHVDARDASHKPRPSASAQFGAEEKCSENSFATMRNELIRSKPETRNRIVRMSSILQVLRLVGATAPNVKPISGRSRAPATVGERQLYPRLRSAALAGYAASGSP